MPLPRGEGQPPINYKMSVRHVVLLLPSLSLNKATHSSLNLSLRNGEVYPRGRVSVNVLNLTKACLSLSVSVQYVSNLTPTSDVEPTVTLHTELKTILALQRLASLSSVSV